MDKSKLKIVIISTLNYFKEEKLSILILEAKVLIPIIKKVNIAIINLNAYYISFKLKKTQIFTIFIRDLKYQSEKKSRLEINSKIVRPEKYHNLLEIFSKKNLDTLLLYQKYEYKIIFEDKQKYYYTFFYKILL